ncbi:hypothetical protein, partial [Thiolapillus sp.]|uniref:hypothetical protein n=1 Tax=Thiolapillus sp. TaxID=2017437 RepID=UPI003AF80DF5
TPRSEAYFVFPLAQGTPGKQCGLAATGVYQPSLRSPWLAAHEPRHTQQADQCTEPHQHTVLQHQMNVQTRAHREQPQAQSTTTQDIQHVIQRAWQADMGKIQESTRGTGNNEGDYVQSSAGSSGESVV